MPRLLLAVAIWAAALGLCRSGAAQDLVADLSDHVIAINTGFTGTKVLLFGATEGEGDVAVVVRGPADRATVREKDRVAGIWLNHASLKFNGVPGFYAVASSKPLEQLAPPPVLERAGIGLKYLQLAVSDDDREAGPEVIAAFRDALIRGLQRGGLYVIDTGQISFLGGRLFRTRIEFPANVPTGQYQVETYLFRGGQVVDAQTTPLIVGKVGMGAEIYGFAQDEPALYGLAAIIVAVAAGWLASVVFRRA
ncbi:TIGR02186 family protein [Inquilinus sp. CA228]|uniref:TIGR02186 family protein n=1 Tax=Inquilinus sp. CA228 TaxID=3455609 RepID=UPI003F8D34DE